MKKICVFSDSHGCYANMLRAIESEKPDMIIHLGDGNADLAVVSMHYPDIPIDCVRGNCDLHSTALMVLNEEFYGKRIFAVHGHMFDVKTDPQIQKLKMAAMENDADIILFGHTHTTCKDRSWAMEILNPGTCGDVSVPTYGVLLIDGEDIQTEIRQVV